MIKVWHDRNIYKAENFTEKISSKVCCKAVSPYVIKCSCCQKFVCFNHVWDEALKGKKDFELFCFKCFIEVKAENLK